MQIQINNKFQTIPEGTSLQELVSDILKLSSKGIAIAINQEVISKNNWNSTKLSANDSLLIIKASQGG
jgi:sulfur carrier protein